MTVTAAAPPAAQSGAPARAARPTPRRPGLRGAFEGTPGGLRAVALVAVLASLAFAVLGALAFQDRAEALGQARADAAQLVRVQEISIELVRADAAATNAFLSAGVGLPPAEQLRVYDESLATAARRIADAARAQPADAPALALVNADLALYSARVTTALQTKRTSQTLGTGYLNLASNTLLRQGMLPRLDTVVAADARRVDDAFAASERAGTMLLASGVAVVLVMVGGAVWMARRTRRVVNVPLTGATAAVALTLVVGGLVMVSTQSRAREVRDTEYAATRALAEARIAASRAKGDEAVTLIRQNFTLKKNGETLTFVDPGAATIAAAQSRITAAVRSGYAGDADPLLAQWKRVHEQVIAAVNDNDVARAVDVATGPTGKQGSSNAAFAAFDAAVERDLRDGSQAVADGLGGPGPLLLLLGLAALVIGLLAAAASWLGVSQRLEEYR